ncbi:thioredoxin fold domain-containing protein [uncultured Pontibacter sp.]|uniref:thioredoxin family protein n=1 Tax=uncultured Pontibacter sp. TaxID=453356 RepID=UPI0026072D1B|nr:thioredoxin fold domain-containing protein [uncultured Pontibacter sp.]
MLKRTLLPALIATALLTSCQKNMPPVASADAPTAGATTDKAQAPAKAEKIKWLTIEQAAARIKEEPRKVVIDVYTDWCGWCKKMDKSTFTDPEVAALINKHYYAVKLDAEGQEPITLNGHTYTFKPEYRSHELAVALLNGQMSYPTTVYLDEKFNMLAPVPGYLDAKNFSKILRYFGEDHHKQMDFKAYDKQSK